MDLTEQLDKLQEFFEKFYLDILLKQTREGLDHIQVDFNELAQFNPDLAQELLDQPEELLKACETAVTRIEGINMNSFTVRFHNIPDSQHISIRNIRAKHIGKLIQIEGIIRQKSDVRPQVTKARFECPSCGHTMDVLQLDTKFREPSGCTCGRKGKFRLLSKELVDAQKIVLEEAPEDLDGGEQPKRLDIFLKNDLVSPLTEKKTNPGSKIIVSGLIKEIPILSPDGGKLTRFDLIKEANYIEPVQEDFFSMELSEEDKEEIREISEDPNVFDTLANSIAPSIYGHEKIKEALVLMLMGGMRKVRTDGVVTRGDIHMLLIGDPGSGKSQMLKRTNIIAPKSRFVAGQGTSGRGLCVSADSTIMTNPGGMETIKNVVEDRLSVNEEYVPGVWKQDEIADIKIQSLNEDLKIQSKHPKSIWKLKAPDYVYTISLTSGKEITLTANTKLYTIKKGRPYWKKSSEIKIDDYIATPRRLMGGNVKRQRTIDLIYSNPVCHNIKPFVKQIVTRLSEKYGTIRSAAEALEIKEEKLYYNWVNKKARGNIKLNDLKALCNDSRVTWQDKVNEISLYNGKKHTIPTHLSKELLYVAGLITGDGDIRKSKSTLSVRLSSSEPELHKHFRNLLKKEFRLKFDIRKGDKNRPEATRTHSKIIGEILHGLGIPISPKSDKIYMSNYLLHLTNELLSEYVAGLFDSDGSISISKTGDKTIEFYSCSKKLVKQMQVALLRFEIQSRIRKRLATPNKKINSKLTKYVLSIRSQYQIIKFHKHIPIKHPKKKKKLEEIINIRTTTNTNTDIIPSIDARFRESNIPTKILGYKSNISRKRAKKIIREQKIEDAELNKIINSDIFWDKVKGTKVTRPKHHYVYDLTVEDSHNFVVDGILVHNTAAVVRDEFMRGYALEAGAMVLANQGICCIDELDKMGSEDRSAMHEALEQQTVTINKANIHATLRCETTVLAAANPKWGRFDPYELLAKQIDLPSTLINRFDLIFPIRDIPNLERDTEMAGFILQLHKESSEENEFVADKSQARLDTDSVKKYLAYAKQTCRPRLTQEALETIKEYYVKMRGQGGDEGEGIKAIPISARQLEALIRLSEARAKTRLSKEVTEEDAKKAIEIVHYCLSQIGMDPETGKIDIDRITTGITASARGNIAQIREIINELEKAIGKAIPEEDIVREAENRNISREETEEILEKLKRKGDIFSPKTNIISKL